MTMRKVLPFLLLAGLAVASTPSYKVTLPQTVMLGSTELKAGEYKIEVNDQKAILHNGKVQTESPVKVEENDTKFPSTAVRYVNADGKVRIQEIRIGGTKTRLVFSM
jgi:biopolymer transport protein ExbD